MTLAEAIWIAHRERYADSETSDFERLIARHTEEQALRERSNAELAKSPEPSTIDLDKPLDLIFISRVAAWLADRTRTNVITHQCAFIVLESLHAQLQQAGVSTLPFGSLQRRLHINGLKAQLPANLNSTMNAIKLYSAFIDPVVKEQDEVELFHAGIAHARTVEVTYRS